MYKQNASPRHLLRGADRPRPVARASSPSWSAPATTTPKFVPVSFVDYTAGYDSECAVLFPETFSTAERPPEPLRRDLLRPRGRALPPRLRRRRRDPAASTCRPTPPACSTSPELSQRRLHRLGPDPRPHPHARRPALRPVHDPPAQPVLDVLAGGAALRPDRVRRGGRSSSARASPSPATSSTRSSSTACSASRSPAAGCATTTASAASSCSPSSTARATCTGPTTG